MVNTTLAYTTGPGAAAGPRRDPADEDTASPEYRQNATYALRFELAPGVEVVAETHGGEDVPLWAVGPRAHYFGGTIDQPFIFHVLARALELDQDPAD
jgi:alkaline phosphatase